MVRTFPLWLEGSPDTGAAESKGSEGGRSKALRFDGLRLGCRCSRAKSARSRVSIRCVRPARDRRRGRARPGRPNRRKPGPAVAPRSRARPRSRRDFQRRDGGREGDGTFSGDRLDTDDKAGLNQFLDGKRRWRRSADTGDLLSVIPQTKPGSVRPRNAMSSCEIRSGLSSGAPCPTLGSRTFRTSPGYISSMRS